MTQLAPLVRYTSSPAFGLNLQKPHKVFREAFAFHTLRFCKPNDDEYT